MDIPGYDIWKCAIPLGDPEYEEEGQRCDCGDYPIDEVPSSHNCSSALEPGLYETEEDITW